MSTCQMKWCHQWHHQHHGYCHVHDKNKICLSNATYKPHMPIRSCPHDTSMSVYMPPMNLLQSTMWTGTQVDMHFTLLAYAPV